MDPIDYLPPLAEKLSRLKRSHGATPFYDVMCAGLIWSDEKIHGLPAEELGCLRCLFRYRSSLILADGDDRFLPIWEAMKARCPDWIGFAPERCTPSKELVRLAPKASAPP